MRGDAAEGDWLVYRNAKTGLSFRYPPSMGIEEQDPAKFGFDEVPDAIVDLRADRLPIGDFIQIPPPHDGKFPLLSILHLVHFESATK